MRSFEEMKDLVKKAAAESKAHEDAVRANPALARTPEAIARYRRNGMVMLVLGLGISFATYMGYQETGRALVIAISAGLVLTLGGAWTLITGTNPFRPKK